MAVLPLGVAGHHRHSSHVCSRLEDAARPDRRPRVGRQGLQTVGQTVHRVLTGLGKRSVAVEVGGGGVVVFVIGIVVERVG